MPYGHKKRDLRKGLKPLKSTVLQVELLGGIEPPNTFFMSELLFVDISRVARTGATGDATTMKKIHPEAARNLKISTRIISYVLLFQSVPMRCLIFF